MKNCILVSFVTLILFAAFSSGAETSEPLVLRSTKVLTDPEPERAWAGRSTPRSVAVDGGYCVAWNDQRQGGALLAARIDENGQVLDRLGIPLATEGAYPEAVLRTWEGCAVFYGSQKIALIDEHGQTRLLYEGPDWGQHVATTDETALFARVVTPSITNLEMVDGYGMTVAEGTIEGVSDYDPQISADIGGERVFLVRSSRDADSGLVELWSGDTSLNLEQIASIETDALHAARVASDGKNALLATAEVSSSSVGWGNVRARLFTPSGEMLSEVDLDLPTGHGARLGEVRFDEHFEITWSTDHGMYVVVTDGYTVFETRNVSWPGHVAVATGNGGRTLRVYHDGRRDLVYSLDDSEERRLTSTFRPEVLVDAAVQGETLALLWYESDYEENKAHLFAKVTQRDRIDLSDPVPVAEFRSPFHQPIWDAGLAIRGDEILIVWFDGNTIRYRRLGSDGEWRDSGPSALSPPERAGRIDFDRSGIFADENDYTVTWWASDALFAASIDADGHEVRRFTGQEHRSRPVPPSILRVGDRYLAVWREPHLCEITCIPIPDRLQIALLDLELEVIEQATLETFSAPILAMAGGEPVVLLRDEILRFSGQLQDGLGEIQRIEIHQSNIYQSWSEAVWTGSGFLVTAHAAGPIVGRLSLEGTFATIGPELFAMEDRARPGHFEYAPFAFERGESVVLLGSEVTVRQEEGLVRRLRETVFGSAVDRGRTVRRRR